MNTFFMKIALLTLMVRHSGAVNSCITDTIATNLAGQSDIDLVGCGLGDADHEDLSDFFDNVGRLTIVNLDMSENDFESLPADLFEGMFIATQSSSMFINGNQLTTLPDGLFELTRYLTIIELKDNGLETLPENIFDGPWGYEVLKITGNNLDCLPEIIYRGSPFILDVDPGVRHCGYMDCEGDSLSISNSYCDDANQNEACAWDGGDCCKCDCSGIGCTVFWSNGPTPVTCEDPNSECQDDEFKASAEPTPAPTDDPVPVGPVCSNGVSGYDGSNSNGQVCCAVGCGGCGGRGCRNFGSEFGLSGADCCINGILRAQDDCSVTGEAPCIVRVD